MKFTRAYHIFLAFMMIAFTSLSQDDHHEKVDKVLSKWPLSFVVDTLKISERYYTETIYDSQTESSSLRDVFIADTYGALSLDAPHEASFTPYDEVTKEMVEGWLADSLDCEAIEANLDAQIQNFLNPPIVAYPLPWTDSKKI